MAVDREGCILPYFTYTHGCVFSCFSIDTHTEGCVFPYFSHIHTHTQKAVSLFHTHTDTYHTLTYTTHTHTHTHHTHKP